MAEDFLSLDAQEQGDILRTVAVRYQTFQRQAQGPCPALRRNARRSCRWLVGSEAPEFDVLIEQLRSVESDANRRT